MSEFPRAPRLLKGAIVGVDLYNPLASVVMFQYNPEKLSRRVSANAPAAEGGAGARHSARHEALRLQGPPRETITAQIVVDAADALEQADPLATRIGVHPALASLEMLLYPKAAYMIANHVLANVGMLEVLAPKAPLTLFVWGPARVLPVEIRELSIEEEFFDPNLNPIRASVQLSMTVLTYQDLGIASVGGALHLAHQVAKEVMATMGGIGTIAGAATGSLSIG